MSCEDEDEGVGCIDCGEWFETIYNNNPWNSLKYCPLCGYKFSEEDLAYMVARGDEE